MTTFHPTRRAAAIMAITIAAGLGESGGEPAFAKATITKFDPPGSIVTYAKSINGTGAIAGWYLDKDERKHSFLRAPDGTITVFDTPHAGKRRLEGTQAEAINDDGVVTGSYRDAEGSHGFLRKPNGNVVEFDVPESAIATFSNQTEPACINSKGAIAGTFAGADGRFHAFLRTPRGEFITFAHGSKDNHVSGINDSGFIAGMYEDSNNRYHGFVRAPDGTIESFDAPNSEWTLPAAINKQGIVAGAYTKGGNRFGFVRAAGGTITKIDIKDADYTEAMSINVKGTIVGDFGQRDKTFAYVRAEDGAIKTFSAPKSEGTVPLSINANGDIAGLAYNNVDFPHGFVRTK